MVHEIVGRINGQFGTLTYVPIYHLDTSLSFTELCALYAVTDVALVTSLVRKCKRESDRHKSIALHAQNRISLMEMSH